MTEAERMKRLLQMAERDENYKVWKYGYEESAPKFAKFAKWWPPKIRNHLYGYAECGRLMYQRMVNIACKNMAFLDEEKK